MKKKKIAMIARTIGLEYDDRIRKECISLSKNADVHIYVNLTDNREEEGVTSYGIPYKSFRLKTRDRFESSKHLLIKAAEFYLRVRKYLNNYEIIWAHEIYTFMFPLLLKKNQCVWDLHEIPFRFQKFYMRALFRYIESKCLKLIHANEYRIKYLTDKRIIKHPDKHIAIKNYPDRDFCVSKITNTQQSQIHKWLDGVDYVYLQGLSFPRRYPANSIEAVLRSSHLKVVVTGNIDKTAYEFLEQKYGDEIKERVFLMGMVEQLQIPSLIAPALFSIILYDISTPNNRFCEPNRMYQAIAMGVPVIVGCNEPMKDIVERYKFGISLKSDGRDVTEIETAIIKILKQREHFKVNILENYRNILWEQQETLLLNPINVHKV